MELVKRIARAVKDSGGRAFLVGGYPRDRQLGIESKDYDMEVFKLEPGKLQKILKKFGDVNYVGASFGVFKLHNIDISIPRTDRKNGVGHTGFDVNINPFMSYRDACQRRDLTINALMLDPLTNEIIDCFDGLSDIKSKTIRFINSDRFTEDPLRVLRVAGLTARLGFNPDYATSSLCWRTRPKLRFLSSERILTEIEKILLKAEKPSLAFNWMYTWGVLEILFPEIYDLFKVAQGKKYHPEGTAGRHTMLALDAVPMKDRTLAIMFAVLLHDTGKATCASEVSKTDPDHIHFKGHEKDSADIAGMVLERLTNQESLIREVQDLVVFHMLPYQLKHNMKKKLIRRLATKIDIPSLMVVHRADLNGRGIVQDLGHIDDIECMYDDIKSEIKPIVCGRHLISECKLEPSPLFGEILRDVYEAQLDGEFNTLKDGLEFTNGYLMGKIAEDRKKEEGKTETKGE